jgi:hypothetical protein
MDDSSSIVEKVEDFYHKLTRVKVKWWVEMYVIFINLNILDDIYWSRLMM